MKKVSNLDDALGVINQTIKGKSATVVAMGSTAYPRTGLLGLVDDLQILCIQQTADLDQIKERVKVVSLEGDLNVKNISKYNTSTLLAQTETKEFLKSLNKKVYGFIYKSSKAIENELVDGMEILTNRSNVRQQFEDKWRFRGLAKEAGLKMADGIQMKLAEMNEEKLTMLQAQFGERLVFQLPDFTVGGGLGTFFINSLKDWEWLAERIELIKKQGRDLTKLNVTKYMDGESVSMTGCVTRHGILTSLIQRQLIDIPEAVDIRGRSGVFVGHEWGDFFETSLNQKVQEQVVKLGEFMRTKGYRGIFGIDLVIKPETNEVTVIECNARYTGAFPIYSMLQKANGEIPLDVWHLLEFLEADYEFDREEMQKQLWQTKVGAQIIIHNIEHAFMKVLGEVKTGVYQIVGEGEVVYLRPGLTVEELKNENEFLLVDAVPRKSEILKPGRRMGRLVFKKPVRTNGVLNEEVRQVIKNVYRSFQLEKTDKPVVLADEENGFE